MSRLTWLAGMIAQSWQDVQQRRRTAERTESTGGFPNRLSSVLSRSLTVEDQPSLGRGEAAEIDQMGVANACTRTPVAGIKSPNLLFH
jgi:hypothetical protein